ncbi:MAG: bifunctional folylpolyglutamate synthase/dihydrofolate synthase, partial [Myxococcales bacterium]
MRPELNYHETLDWLFALEAQRGMDFRLERLRRVLSILGDPQSAFPAIHVGGTNGKGSTAAMLHSIYTRAGYRVGLYTSPHLLSFRERVRIGEDVISEPEVVKHTQKVRAAADSVGVDLTFFEIATIMAFLEFRRCAVDLAIVEVGLGGRLDATNVVEPVATIVTSVSLEHCEYLGDTIAEIAGEKAGIFKRGAFVVTGSLCVSAMGVVRERASEFEVPWYRYGDDFDDDVLVSREGSPFELA